MLQESVALLHSDSKLNYVYFPIGHINKYLYICVRAAAFMCVAVTEWKQGSKRKNPKGNASYLLLFFNWSSEEPSDLK